MLFMKSPEISPSVPVLDTDTINADRIDATIRESRSRLRYGVFCFTVGAIASFGLVADRQPATDLFSAYPYMRDVNLGISALSFGVGLYATVKSHAEFSAAMTAKLLSTRNPDKKV